jgi:hypothetical protein
MATLNDAGATPPQHALQLADLTHQFAHPRIRYPILAFEWAGVTAAKCREGCCGHEWSAEPGGEDVAWVGAAAVRLIGALRLAVSDQHPSTDFPLLLKKCDRPAKAQLCNRFLEQVGNCRMKFVSALRNVDRR